MTDTSPTANRQLTTEGRSQSIYGQSGYQLRRFDQRIADVEEIRAWLSRFHDEAMVAGYNARLRQLDQLEADLLEADNARARYLEDLDGSISESELYRPGADVDGGDVAFETGVPTVGGGQLVEANHWGPSLPVPDSQVVWFAPHVRRTQLIRPTDPNAPYPGSGPRI